MVRPHGSLAVRFENEECVSRPFGHYWFLPIVVGFYDKKLTSISTVKGGDSIMSATLSISRKALHELYRYVKLVDLCRSLGIRLGILPCRPLIPQLPEHSNLPAELYEYCWGNIFSENSRVT
jgi:hypothetical protein